MEIKICIKCNLEKSLEDFHRTNRALNKLSSWCKQCKKEYDVIYRQSDKIQNLYHSQDYRDRKAEYRKYRDQVEPREQIINSLRSRSKQYNLPFNLEVKDIIIPEYCPLLEIKLERKPYGKRGSFQANSPSVDKIIPELGYVKGNIMVMSMKANAMKYNASIEELKIFSKNVLKIFKDD